MGIISRLAGNRYIILIICAVVILWGTGVWSPGSPADVSVQQENKVNELLQDRKNTIDMVKGVQRETPGTRAGAVPAEYWYKLYRLYYDGVHDKYDLRGNKILGVKPDPTKAMKYLHNACRVSGDSRLWLQLAGIYHNGMFNFEPQLEYARDMYQNIYKAYLPQVQQGGQAAQSAWDACAQAGAAVNEIKKELHTRYVHGWLNLKTPKRANSHHDRITKAWAPGGAGNGGRGVVRAAGHFGQPTPITANELFRAGTPNARANAHANANGMDVLDVDDIRNNDMHNTHNSQVVSTVARSLMSR